MTEISMPAWMFALVIAGTALSASALVGWGMAIVAMAVKPTPEPYGGSELDAAFDRGYSAGRGEHENGAM